MLSFNQNNFHRLGILFLCLLFLSKSGFNALGQQAEGSNWLFGDSVSLSFLPGPGPNLTNLNLSSSDDGPGSISDKHGKLLFYTNGEDVFTKNGEIMPNGQGISFGPRGSRKKSIIVPKPGSANSYYVITVGGYFSLSNVAPEAWLSEVNMELNGGLGDVVEGKKNILIRQNVTIGLSVAAHSNGVDKWLILHKRISTNTFLPGSRIYEFYLITQQGISFVKSQIAPITHGILAADYIFNYVTSPNSKILVGGSEFDDRIHTFILAQDTGGFVQSYFGGLFDYLTKPAMAFSPNSKFLYVADIGRLYQINLDTFPLQYAQRGQLPVTRPYLYGNFQLNNTVYYTDLQLAPNGKIYVIPYKGAKFLASIECPNVRGVGCTYKDSSVWLGGRKTGYSFPVLNQTLFVNAGKLQAQAAKDTICVGDSVTILAYGAGAEQFQWFRNQETVSFSSVGQIKVAPTQTTTYRVKGTGVCANKDTSVRVVVVPRPVVNLGTERQVCEGSTFTLSTPAQASVRYGWGSNLFPGLSSATGPSVNLSAPGCDSLCQAIVRVQVSNSGCTVSDSVRISVFGKPKHKPSLSPFPDTSFCFGGSATLQAKGFSQYKTLWSTGDSTRNIQVSGSGIYTVRFKNAQGCISDSSRSVSVTVHPLPVAQTLSNGKKDSTLCFPGKINLGISPQNNVSYQWQGSIVDSLSNATLNNPAFHFANSDTLVKTFDFTLSTFDFSTGCRNNDSLTLKLVPFLRPEAGEDKRFCNENPPTIGLKGIGGFAYDWVPPAGLQNPISAQTPVTLQNPSYENELILPYIRTVRLLGCAAKDTVEVQVFPQVPKPVLSGPQFVCPGVQNVPYQLSTLPAVSTFDLINFTFDLSGGDSVGRLLVNWGVENPNASAKIRLGNVFGCAPDSMSLPVSITRNLRPQTLLTPGLNDSLCLASAQNIGYRISPFNPNSRYRWTIDPQTVTSNSLSFDSILLTFDFPGFYQVKLTESDTTPIAQCFGETEYTVRIWPQPTAKAILGKDSICHLGNEQFTMDNGQWNSQYSWAATKGSVENQTPNGGKVTYSADFGLQIDYTPVEIRNIETSDKGCQGPENVKVIVVESLPRPAIVPPNETLEWKALNDRAYEATGRSGSSFLWQAENGTVVSGQGSSKVEIDWLPNQLRYQLKVHEISRIGCLGESEYFHIPYDSAVFIPNLVTPNGDRRNDQLFIQNLHFYPQNELTIYDRWGKKIHQSSPYEQNWPTDKIQNGLYFFSLSAGGKVMKGWVLVDE